MGKRRIAIIGGGASGVLLLAHLARREGAGTIEVDMFERDMRLGRGIAYSTKHDCHLLNVRAANMSAYADDKDHFAKWAGERGYEPLSFVPRKVYGEYLAEQLEAGYKAVRVTFVQTDVVSSKSVDGGYILNGEELLRYDEVVLASGNVRPLRPKVEEGASGYFDDPWSADFDTLLKAKTIAIVGSGLTAVDMIVALHAQKYGGKIKVFSRNSLMPCVHVPPATYAPFLNEQEQKGTPLSLLRRIRSEIAAAQAQGVPWQAVIDSMRGSTNAIWQNWSEKDRARFMKRLLTFWNVHRHRMAPEIAKAVSMMDVEMVKARVNMVTKDLRVMTGEGAHPADAVINCLGYRYDEAGRNYEVSHRIGPARFGELFETTAIPEIRAQAAELAAKILP